MNVDTLVMMANQIARNVPVRGEEAAIAATAAHIREFWEPRMIGALRAAEPDALSAVARAALARLER